MSVVTDVEKWGNTHRPGFLDIFRIVLGAFVTFKGVYFVTHMSELHMTTNGINVYFAGAVMAHYVIFAHILGGPLILLGLFTRIVCLMQIPILLGAIVFVNYPKGFLSIGNHMELEMSIIVLAGLILFMVFGAGRYSLDEKRRRDLSKSAVH